MAAKSKSGLGRGLEALIGGETQLPENDNANAGILEVSINEVEPGKEQPRSHFDEEQMAQLTESIKEYGIIDPLIVKKEGNLYKIIAGERRWRAARRAGLKKVPILVKEFSSKEAMEVALIENVQRSDLNPIEEAEAYEKLIKEYDLTQDQLASKVGKNRATIANTLRLLSFDKEIRNMLISGSLTQGQARPLLSLTEKEERLTMAKKIAEQDISARQVEILVKNYNEKKAEKENKKTDDIKDELYKISAESDLKAIQNVLHDCLGTKVKLTDTNGKGKIVIEYYSVEERERLIELLKNK